MPALPDVPGVIRVDMHFSYGEDLFAKCRFFAAYSGSAPSVGQLNTFAGVVVTEYDSQLKGLASSSVHLTEVVVTDLTTPTSSVGSTAASVAGTRSGPGLPASACVVQSRHVARRYRGGHSRIYWPFGTGNDNADNQVWEPTFVTQCDTDLTAFGTAIHAAVWSGGGTLTPVSVSYYSGFTTHTGTTGRVRNVSTVRSVPLVDLIVGDTIQHGIGSQRKRLLSLA